MSLSLSIELKIMSLYLSNELKIMSHSLSNIKPNELKIMSLSLCIELKIMSLSLSSELKIMSHSLSINKPNRVFSYPPKKVELARRIGLNLHFFKVGMHCIRQDETKDKRRVAIRAGTAKKWAKERIKSQDRDAQPRKRS